ncbi:MAG: hypothetical protein Q9176_004758 [Flavoplaca citrina]
MPKTKFLTKNAPMPTNLRMASPTPSTAETFESKSDASDTEVSSRTTYKSKPGEQWFVSVLSLTSKCFRWSEEDYEFGLQFGFDPQFSSFLLTSGGMELHALEGSHGCIPFVAIAAMGDRPRLRLIPVVSGFNLQNEVYDVEFDGAGDGERVVRKLVSMGCTVVQRPEG